MYGQFLKSIRGENIELMYSFKDTSEAQSWFQLHVLARSVQTLARVIYSKNQMANPQPDTFGTLEVAWGQDYLKEAHRSCGFFPHMKTESDNDKVDFIYSTCSLSFLQLSMAAVVRFIIMFHSCRSTKDNNKTFQKSKQ